MPHEISISTTAGVPIVDNYAPLNPHSVLPLQDQPVFFLHFTVKVGLTLVEQAEGLVCVPLL